MKSSKKKLIEQRIGKLAKRINSVKKKALYENSSNTIKEEPRHIYMKKSSRKKHKKKKYKSMKKNSKRNKKQNTNNYSDKQSISSNNKHGKSKKRQTSSLEEKRDTKKRKSLSPSSVSSDDTSSYSYGSDYDGLYSNSYLSESPNQIIQGEIYSPESVVRNIKDMSCYFSKDRQTGCLKKENNSRKSQLKTSPDIKVRSISPVGPFYTPPIDTPELLYIPETINPKIIEDRLDCR